MSLDNNRVGENIKRVRMLKGLTQQNIADSVGVTKQTICKIEKTGSTNPATLERIATALHIDMHKLYEPVQEKPLDGYIDFLKDSDYKFLYADCFKPIAKQINDTVVKRMSRQIALDGTPSSSKIDSILKDNGFQSKTYTHDSLKKACCCVWIQAYSDIINTLRD